MDPDGPRILIAAGFSRPPLLVQLRTPVSETDGVKVTPSLPSWPGGPADTSGNGNYDDISAIKVNALTLSKYGLNYAFPARCVKE